MFKYEREAILHTTKKSIFSIVTFVRQPRFKKSFVRMKDFDNLKQTMGYVLLVY